MKPRRRAREVALQILYSFDLSTAQVKGKNWNPASLISDLSRHFDHFQTPDSVREFSAQLVAGTLTHLPSLDNLLEEYAVNWKIERMATIDRTLLRMSTYELVHCEDIPYSVTIDEAIELSKQFGTSESASFINGILDAVKQNLERQKSPIL